MGAPDVEFVVDFPTLGFLVADWIEQHCIIPDGFKRGRPYVMADWQLWCTANHYRVRVDAVWDPDEPRVSTNFYYRRSQIVAPQKTGKGPWAASIIACEGLGPTVFCGWAGIGDKYVCADHGCDCGWEYEYELAEPMGIPRPTPLIQLTATSKLQCKNVFRPLQAMFRGGGLDVSADSRTGEEFIRLPDDGRVDMVTSSAKARLGNPVTFVLHDESGIYTKTNGMVEVADTQLRGLAGMDARGIETTNCWDPSQQSTAQVTFESPAEDIFRFYLEPPKHLSYRNKEERRKIHRFVYQGSWWVNLDAIEGLAVEFIGKGEIQQAERFFGNRKVRGSGKWLQEETTWADAGAVARVIRDGVPVTGGFDGSESDDWTVIRLETADGHSFTPRYGPTRRPTIWNPAEWNGKIPRSELNAAWDELSRRYHLLRVYCDPRGYQTQIGEWGLEYGEKVFVEWSTARPVQTHAALERVVTDLGSGVMTHDECPVTTLHVGNAQKAAYPKGRYLLQKPSPQEKIDAAMSTTLAHEAWADATAAGEFAAAIATKKKSKTIVM